VVALAFAGYELGGDWRSVRKGFEYVDYAILTMVVIAIVYVFVRRRRGGGPGDQSSDAPPVTDAG